MNTVTKILGSVGIVGGVLLLGACAESPETTAKIDALNARVTYLEGQAQAAAQCCQDARAAYDRMYRTGLRK